ncbi:hypothetical protein [Thalassobacillus sp. B23F22_16]|uniref:hypothetical protein n=1 Tax=Thalassobacillus sp. B23F22_16 TaxID=3459513 RepID=UPI00373DF462
MFMGHMINRNEADEAVLKLKIPYQHLEDGTLSRVPNPELRGMDADEWVKTVNSEALFGPRASKSSYKALDFPNTLTVEGDTGTEYIEGSNNYKGQSLAGLADYAANHKGRVLRGLGLAGLGAGAVGWGGKKIYYTLEEHHEANK